MGNSHGQLSPQEQLELVTAANFSERDIKKIYRRFRALDTNQNGELDPQELFDIPEISDNPLVKRVISIFDTNEDGRVSFVEFLVGLAKLAACVDEREKLRFAFDIYDIDKDGHISNGELFSVMKMMVGNNLNDHQLQQLVDRTILLSDKDFDGMISFTEFEDVSLKLGEFDSNKKLSSNLLPIRLLHTLELGRSYASKFKSDILFFENKYTTLHATARGGLDNVHTLRQEEQHYLQTPIKVSSHVSSKYPTKIISYPSKVLAGTLSQAPEIYRSHIRYTPEGQLVHRNVYTSGNLGSASNSIDTTFRHRYPQLINGPFYNTSSDFVEFPRQTSAPLKAEPIINRLVSSNRHHQDSSRVSAVYIGDKPTVKHFTSYKPSTVVRQSVVTHPMTLTSSRLISEPSKFSESSVTTYRYPAVREPYIFHENLPVSPRERKQSWVLQDSSKSGGATRYVSESMTEFYDEVIVDTKHLTNEPYPPTSPWSVYMQSEAVGPKSIAPNGPHRRSQTFKLLNKDDPLTHDQ